MTIPESTPKYLKSDGPDETVTADYRDGLRILAHIIAQKHLQNEHPKLNLKAAEEGAEDCDGSKNNGV